MAIYVNREIKGLNLDEVVVPKLRITSLWLFGGASPDGRRRFLSGDLMSDRRVTIPFVYPEPRVI